jgi:hypothetical protein
MAKLTLSEFLGNHDLLAIRISPENLAGFFRKAVTVPLNTTGLALFADGTGGLFDAGCDISGTFDLVLVKGGEVRLRLLFPDLKTSDGFTLSATADFSVEIATGRLDLFRDFCRTLFPFPGTFKRQDLEDHLAPEVRRILGAYAAARSVAELHRTDLTGPLGSLFQGRLERFLFDAAIR